MKHIYIRPLRGNDEDEVRACVQAFTDANAYLPKGSLAWPSTRMMVAEKDGKPLLYQPIFDTLVLGSLGPVAGISATDFASAQHQITAAAFWEASRSGIGRIYCGGGNLDTEAFCQRHDYRKLRYPMFRLKVL